MELRLVCHPDTGFDQRLQSLRFANSAGIQKNGFALNAKLRGECAIAFNWAKDCFVYPNRDVSKLGFWDTPFYENVKLSRRRARD
jgi:hypothetical protein